MRFPAALPAAALLALGAAALAVNADADLLPGDRLHGNILAPGDSDELRIWLPADAVLTVDALAEKGSALLPVLEVLDPDGVPLDLAAFTQPGPKGVGVKVKKGPAGGKGGVFTFVVSGGGSTGGKYAFRSRAKMPSKFSATLEIPAGEGATFPFDAPAGSTLAWKVAAADGSTADGLAMDGLEAPDASTFPLDGLSGRKVPLAQDGTWLLGVRNDGAAAASAEVSVTLALPKASTGVYWLSPFGFGEAPKVASVTPSKILDDRIAEGVVVAGLGFDAQAVLRLERKGEEPVLLAAATVENGETVVSDIDPSSLAPGTWNVVVENPSGARATGRLKVQSASSVRLPRGVVEDTEVWWLDFDGEAFRADLDLLGLGSATASTRALAEAGVKSYALYYLRRAFALTGRDGKPVEGSVPVSFILEEPPATLGSPGTTFNRIRIGGTAAGGDPSSNPSYPWGNSPLDEGNVSYEDLDPEAEAGLGLRTGALAPSVGTGTPEWLAATLPLRASPLTAADEPWYFGATPGTAAQGTRYRDIEKATRIVGKEIGTTLAHFIARSMGTADGISGASYVPVKVGEYAALPLPGFSLAERAALAAGARAGLPGKSKTLEAAWFPPRETLPYLLPDATTTKPYVQAFAVTGGRPDAEAGDIVYAGISGSIPAEFILDATGGISGTAPLRDVNSQLVGGAFFFLVRWRDKVTGEEFYFAHRLNLLVDTSNPALSPAEVALGQQRNAQTLAE